MPSNRLQRLKMKSTLWLGLLWIVLILQGNIIQFLMQQFNIRLDIAQLFFNSTRTQLLSDKLIVGIGIYSLFVVIEIVIFYSVTLALLRQFKYAKQHFKWISIGYLLMLLLWTGILVYGIVTTVMAGIDIYQQYSRLLTVKSQIQVVEPFIQLNGDAFSIIQSLSVAAATNLQTHTAFYEFSFEALRQYNTVLQLRSFWQTGQATLLGVLSFLHILLWKKGTHSRSQVKK